MESKLRHKIRNIIREALGDKLVCPFIKITEEIKNEVLKYSSDEELLRSGGISLGALDRAAFGFSDEDIKELMPNQLNIKWKDDWDNVKWEQKKSGLSPRNYSLKISLEEPIDVVYEKGKFFIDDGHHRYFAAKTLNKPLKVSLDIKQNPIIELAPSLSYDDFHKCVYKQVKNELSLKENKSDNGFLTVYHGTQPKFVDKIKSQGLEDKTGYNQGWYILSTDFDTALFHANPDENKDFVYVFEFKIPVGNHTHWDGYPYLWKGEKRTENSTWFALMKPIPKNFISDIHKVSFDKWLEQKNKGF